MHVHKVRDYAPPGYKLARTEYADGLTRHVFARVGDAGSEIALECAPSDAAEEIGYLEKFRDMHTPKPAPVDTLVTADTAPAKPSRKRS